MARGWILGVLFFLAGTPLSARGAPQKPPNDAPSGPSSSSSISLSPAVIMVKAQPGNSSSHSMKIANLTSTRLRFVLEACDVVMRDNKRVFVPAGETEGGIALSAIFDPPAVEMNPGESAEVKITLTIPEKPMVRAVAAIFRGQNTLGSSNSIMFTGSLGTLITYNLSDDVAVRFDALSVTPQTGSSSLTVSEQVGNEGHEPVVASGTLAILKSSGELIGRVPIEAHRLLPGEEFNCAAEYPHSLRPGDYRAMMSFQYEGGVKTSSIEFRVP